MAIVDSDMDIRIVISTKKLNAILGLWLSLILNIMEQCY
jgi:hypothetical protein